MNDLLNDLKKCDLDNEPYSECGNCEGEGLVAIWGKRGEEVPASRRTDHPNDWPENESLLVPDYICPICKGSGNKLHKFTY